MRDDAASGARGQRAAPLPRLRELLGDEYGLTVTAPPADLGGSSNLNLLVHTGEGRLLVRVYRRHVEAKRLGTIQVVRKALHEAAIPVPATVPTRSGAGWVRVDGALVEVERYVESNGTMDSWDRLRVGLPWLGRIHSVLAAVEVAEDGIDSPFVNHIGVHELLERTRRGTARIRGWKPTTSELRLADQADELAERLEAAQQEGDLPVQVVHGDFWDDNVRFLGESLVLVTDLEMLGRRPRIDDLALTVYFADSSWGGDEGTTAHVARAHRLVGAYETGLGQPLTAVERTAFPLALARQPLWGIGRWVAMLDDEEAARHHSRDLVDDVDRALQVLRGLDQWRAQLAAGVASARRGPHRRSLAPQDHHPGPVRGVEVSARPRASSRRCPPTRRG